MKVKHNLCKFAKYTVGDFSIIVRGIGTEQKSLSLIAFLDFLCGQISSWLAIDVCVALL